MGKAWQDRRPFKAPPEGSEGKPRRLMKRVRQSAAEARAWAETQAWWPLVTNPDGHPYCDNRFYIFILREEPTT